jgi:hypothetical protein
LNNDRKSDCEYFNFIGVNTEPNEQIFRKDSNQDSGGVMFTVGDEGILYDGEGNLILDEDGRRVRISEEEYREYQAHKK